MNGRRLALLAAVLCVLPLRAEEAAGRIEPLPPELANVGISEHLDAHLPLDLELADETGKPVSLRSFFHPERPVVLALVYFRCPGLCSRVLNGLADSLHDQQWLAGKEFDTVVVSFDPLETPELAAANKERFVELYARPGAGSGVHFLTGQKTQIKALTEAVGFRYAWDETNKQYAHVAAIYICTPDGRLARYLYGVAFEEKTLRLSLLEAAAGRVTSVSERALMFCYEYDPARHRYSLSLLKLMQVACGLTLVTVVAVLGTFWAREAKRRKKIETRGLV